MKKNYTTPIIRTIHLVEQDNVLIGTSAQLNEEETSNAWSNERERTSSNFIWGDED